MFANILNKLKGSKTYQGTSIIDALKSINVDSTFQNRKKIALVIGQVEDDASVKIGADGMKNIELIKQARLSSPKAHIIYKPHPDVLSGNRIGQVDESEALKYCDEVVTGVSMPVIMM